MIKFEWIGRRNKKNLWRLVELKKNLNANPNKIEQYTEILNIYMDKTKNSDERVKALRKLVNQYWNEFKKNLLLPNFRLDYPNVVYNEIGAKITDLEDILAIIKNYGNNCIKKGSVHLGPWQFLQTLHNHETTLWEIISNRNDPDLLAGCVLSIYSAIEGSSFSIESGKALINGEMEVIKDTIENWDSLLNHKYPEVRWAALYVWWMRTSELFINKVIKKYSSQFVSKLEDDDPRVRSFALKMLTYYRMLPDWSIYERFLVSSHPIERKTAVRFISSYRPDLVRDSENLFNLYLNALEGQMKNAEEDTSLEVQHLHIIFQNRENEGVKLILKFVKSNNRDIRWDLYSLTMRIHEHFPWEDYKINFWDNFINFPRDRGQLGQIFGLFKDIDIYNKIKNEYFNDGSKKLDKTIQRYNKDALIGFLAFHKVEGTIPILASEFPSWFSDHAHGGVGYEVIMAFEHYTKEEIMQAKEVDDERKRMIFDALDEHGGVLEKRLKWLKDKRSPTWKLQENGKT